MAIAPQVFPKTLLGSVVAFLLVVPSPCHLIWGGEGRGHRHHHLSPWQLPLSFSSTFLSSLATPNSMRTPRGLCPKPFHSVPGYDPTSVSIPWSWGVCWLDSSAQDPPPRLSAPSLLHFLALWEFLLLVVQSIPRCVGPAGSLPC